MSDSCYDFLKDHFPPEICYIIDNYNPLLKFIRKSISMLNKPVEIENYKILNSYGISRKVRIVYKKNIIIKKQKKKNFPLIEEEYKKFILLDDYNNYYLYYTPQTIFSYMRNFDSDEEEYIKTTLESNPSCLFTYDGVPIQYPFTENVLNYFMLETRIYHEKSEDKYHVNNYFYRISRENLYKYADVDL